MLLSVKMQFFYSLLQKYIIILHLNVIYAYYNYITFKCHLCLFLSSARRDVFTNKERLLLKILKINIILAVHIMLYSISI